MSMLQCRMAEYAGLLWATNECVARKSSASERCLLLKVFAAGGDGGAAAGVEGVTVLSSDQAVTVIADARRN